MHIVGKLLWKNDHSARKSPSSLPDDVERIMTMLDTTEGILGASVINRGHGASIIALVIISLRSEQNIYRKEN